jgi:adenosylcobinamide-GDP ribazoletransferase
MGALVGSLLAGALQQVGGLTPGQLMMALGGGMAAGVLAAARGAARLGGITGDVMGATCEVAQATAWMVAAVAASGPGA